MITEKDLQEAIAECQGQRNPNANTCIKLASYYIILNQMKEPTPSYSYAPPNNELVSDYYYSDTEFMKVAGDMMVDEVLPIIDDLMVTVMVLNPKLYNSVIRKLKGEG